jgi:hypothetical protein
LTGELQTLTGWCHEHLTANARLLIHDAGYLSTATVYPLTDMVGLKSPDCLKEHRELTWTSGGRRRIEAIQRIAMRERDQYLIATEEWDRGFQLSAGLRACGWKVQQLNPPKDCYRIYQLTPPALAAQPTGLRSPRSPSGG